MNRVFAARGVRAAACVGLCVLLAGLAGCGGGDKASVAGKVTYKGAPLTGGTLTLYSDSGSPYPIYIKPDGSFAADQTPIGSMKVAVETDSVPSEQASFKPPPGMTLTKDSTGPPPRAIPTGLTGSSSRRSIKIPKRRD